MTFAVRLSERALKDLSRVPREVQGRILRKLEEAARDPARFFRRLAGERVHRLRVGDYRVLAEIVPRERIIRVQHVGHRKNVYE